MATAYCPRLGRQYQRTPDGWNPCEEVDCEGCEHWERVEEKAREERESYLEDQYMERDL